MKVTEGEWNTACAGYNFATQNSMELPFDDEASSFGSYVKEYGKSDGSTVTWTFTYQRAEFACDGCKDLKGEITVDQGTNEGCSIKLSSFIMKISLVMLFLIMAFYLW